MTEAMQDVGSSEVVAAALPPAASAGSLLRAARMAQDLDLGSLATQLKVPVRKLEALEADRYTDLQGAIFVRALAQAACRALKIDAAPVLALLPKAELHSLGAVEGGLNTPFHEHGHHASHSGLPWGVRPVHLFGVLLVLAAVALWSLPSDWLTWEFTTEGATVDSPSPPASAVVSVVVDLPAVAASADPVPSQPTALASAVPSPVLAASTAKPVVSLAPAAGLPALPPAASAPPAAGASAASTGVQGPLEFKVRERSWIEVADGNNQVLLARLVQPDETVRLGGVLPLRVKVGNAAATELSFRGQRIDLLALTRDNVVRLELK